MKEKTKQQAVEEVTIPNITKYMFLDPKKVKKGRSRTIEICPDGTWRFKLRREKLKISKKNRKIK